MKRKRYSLFTGLVLMATSSYMLSASTIATFSKSDIEVLQDKKDNQYIIHNNSDYLLKDIKMPKGVECSKTVLAPGELINCKISALTTKLPVLTAKVYALKSLEAIKVANGSFENASFDSWSKKGIVDIDSDSYQNKDGDFVSLLLADNDIENSAEISKLVSIKEGKAYRVYILAAFEKSGNNNLPTITLN